MNGDVGKLGDTGLEVIQVQAGGGIGAPGPVAEYVWQLCDPTSGKILCRGWNSHPTETDAWREAAAMVMLIVQSEQA